MTKLPLIELVIDENAQSDSEVSAIAFVDKPAIEKNFLAFKDVKLDFAVDSERQIVSGPAMVPEIPIYRRDGNGEYNVFFSKDTVEKIALKFFKKDYQKNLNLFHDPSLSLDGVTIFESFISDKSRGVAPMKGFEDLPDGSWFISAKVENPQVWQQIKSGAVKGFSVEGIFSYMKKPKSLEDSIYEAISATLIEDSHLRETGFMSSLKDKIANFKKYLFEGTPLVNPPAPQAQAAAPAPNAAPQAPSAPTEYKLKDGSPVSIDKLEVGGTVLMAGVPCPAGEYELQDGSRVTVGDGGVITLVTPSAVAAPPPVLMADVEAAINKALNAYKEQMAAEKLAMEQKMADADKKSKETIKEIFAIVEEIAATETAKPVAEPSRQSFNKKAQEDSDEKVKRLAENLKKLRTA